MTFQFTSSASPTWCTSHPNLLSSPHATHSLPSLPALLMRSTRGGSFKRVHDLFGLSNQWLLPSVSLAAVNVYTTSAWLDQSILAGIAALSAHGTSSSSCLTLLRRLPSNTSNTSIFPTTLTRLLRTQRSTLSVFLTTCHFHLSSLLCPHLWSS